MMSRIQRFKKRLPFVFKANHVIDRAVDSLLDIDFYRDSYNDLKDMSDIELENHWVRHGKQEGRLGNLDSFLEQHSAKREDLELFDAEFYVDFYGDLSAAGMNSFVEIAGHYLDYGMSEGRHPNFESYLSSVGINPKLWEGKLKFSEFVGVNERKGVPVTYQMVLETLNMISPVKISFFDSEERDSRFYADLGCSFEIGGEEDKAEKSYCLSLLMGGRKGIELLGNIALRRRAWNAAITYYKRAIGSDCASNWAYLNIAKAYYEVGMPEQCMESIVSGFRAYPESLAFRDALDSYVSKYWLESQAELDALANMQMRDELVECVEGKVNFISNIYKDFYSQFGGGVKKKSIRTSRVLIVGDYHISQCIRYRIDQKVEQLELQGCVVETIDWTKIKDEWSKFTFVDVVIFYRVPAVPEVVKVMAYLKSLGKRTFYDIDDLLFTREYPARLDSFAGYVNIEQYRDLTKGMALFQSAIKRCEYGIASTIPLAREVSRFVYSKRCYVHRNGIDKLTKESECDLSISPVKTIFYGSGTQAHNSDFVDQALPGIERVLKENPDVRLVVVGYLKLPASFISKYGEQLSLIPFVSDMDAYWDLLGSATINIAVLENDSINACKSELKWFESAILGVPSIVSYTDNYRDVLNDGVDALVSHDSHDWYGNITRLISDEALRKSFVEESKLKIRNNYYPEPLSSNIKNIISLRDDAVVCLASECL